MLITFCSGSKRTSHSAADRADSSTSSKALAETMAVDHPYDTASDSSDQSPDGGPCYCTEHSADKRTANSSRSTYS